MKRACSPDGSESDSSETKSHEPTQSNDLHCNGVESSKLLDQNGSSSFIVNEDDDLDEESDIYVINQLKNRRDLVQKLPEASIDSSSAVDVRFNPASKDVCVCFSNKLVFYELKDGELSKTKEKKIKKYTPLQAVRFDPNGDYVYLISQDCLLSLHPDEDSPPDSTERLEDKPVTMAVGDTYAVVGTDIGKIHVYEMENMSLVFSMIMGHSQIESLIINRDKVFTICENQVCSVNLTTRAVEHEMDHTTDLLCGTVHNNSLACGSTSGEIVLYKLSNLTSQGSFSISKRISVLDIVSINLSSVAVSLDNGHIKLYSLFPNAEIGIIGVVDTFSTSLDVSSDGDWLIVKDNMSGFKLFDLSFTKQKSGSRKRKKGKSNSHLPTSSFEDSNTFFSSLS